MKRWAFFVLFVAIFVSAAWRFSYVWISDADLAESKDSLSQLLKASENDTFYSSDIQPIFDSKCVACHSCFNSPCQLNLTSYEGVMRGAHSINIYDFPKLEARQPTRLFQDAHDVESWRELGFYSVVDRGDKSSSIIEHYIAGLPGIESGKQDEYDSENSRVCIDKVTESNLEKVSEKNPAARMPFGLPGLSKKEVGKIRTWVNQGAKGKKLIEIERIVLGHESVQSRVEEFEQWLNQDNPKNKLVARYLYEHLFLADLYFEELPHQFFRLVRSKTRSGDIVELATPRPFDPVDESFHYRLRPTLNTITHKQHIPFRLTSDVVTNWQSLFFNESWSISNKQLPKYGDEGANPFITFSAIPAKARYQLFLDNSLYFIMTFMKGPVCRGQTALNVINDKFWVFFLDPSYDSLVNNSETMAEVSRIKSFPSEIGDDFEPLADFKEKYWKAVETKFGRLSSMKPLSFESIWNGNKKNLNAAVTVYRHFDSAHVLFGLQGDMPKTVWVLDYQVFESIYYNLTAGYNVFGPLMHQVNSRLFMEVSRVASEDLFLSFLPSEARLPLRNNWNQKVPSQEASIVKAFVELFSDSAKEKLSEAYDFQGRKVRSTITFENSKGAKQELIEGIKKYRLSDRQITGIKKIDSMVKQFSTLASSSVRFLPDTIALLVGNGSESTAWTLVHNKAHYNVAMILFEDDRRKPEDDSLDVISGIATSYINLMIRVESKDFDSMLEDFRSINSQERSIEVLKKWGVNRSQSDFWEVFNEFNERSERKETNETGVLDLNRYMNI